MDVSAGDIDDISTARGVKLGGSKRIVAMITSLMLMWVITSARTVPPAHIGLSVTLGAVSGSSSSRQRLPLSLLPASGTVLPSGIHFLNPLSSVVIFNMKTQIVYTENQVPTQEGLNVELDVSLLYHVQKDKLMELYLTLGEDFENILIIPELQAAVRGLTSEVNAKSLYTSGRTEIRNK